VISILFAKYQSWRWSAGALRLLALEAYSGSMIISKKDDLLSLEAKFEVAPRLPRIRATNFYLI
jgi:hypothetical protein